MESRSNTFVMERGERAAMVKHQDNLKLEGSMNMRRSGSFASRGERAGVIRRADNLKMEGTFEGRASDSASTSRRVSNASTVSRRSDLRDKSNIVIGDDSTSSKLTSRAAAGMTKQTVAAAGITKSTAAAGITRQTAAAGMTKSTVAAGVTKQTAAAGMTKSSVASASTTTKQVTKSQKQSSVSSTKESSATTSRANASSGLQSALVQNDSTSTGSITAVNNDKFASSLRESNAASATAVHQKEMSVIEHHRKQSLQKAQRSEMSSIGGGYELNAHTGRTAAYGGRDYEYSSALVGGGRRSEVSRDYGNKSSGQY